MSHRILRLVHRLLSLATYEGGQDIVEYALVLSLIAATVTASTHAMAIVLLNSLSNIAAVFNGTY